MPLGIESLVILARVLAGGTIRLFAPLAYTLGANLVLVDDTPICEFRRDP
jgi:hypothetical protein